MAMSAIGAVQCEMGRDRMLTEPLAQNETRVLEKEREVLAVLSRGELSVFHEQLFY